MPKKRPEAHRCLEMSQDLNWHGTHNQFWGAFKEKFPQYEKIDNRQLKEIMDCFWKYTAKVLVETENGIMLSRIGYLALTVFDHPKKVVKWNNKILPNYKTEGACYRCYFYPIREHHSPFKGWMFSINDALKVKIKEQILERGIRYKNHIRLLDKNSKVINN